MIHHATKLKPQSDHWAVSWTGKKLLEAHDSLVLVQLQEDGIQARVALSPEEAETMAAQLKHFAEQVRAANAHASFIETCAQCVVEAEALVARTPADALAKERLSEAARRLEDARCAAAQS